MTAGELVARRVRELRRGRGWTQVDLAEALGWGRMSVVRLETGERSATVDDLVQLAAVLNVAPIQLVAPWTADERLEVDDQQLDGPAARDWLRGLRALHPADPQDRLDAGMALARGEELPQDVVEEQTYFAAVPPDDLAARTELADREQLAEHAVDAERERETAEDLVAQAASQLEELQALEKDLQQRTGTLVKLYESLKPYINQQKGR